MVGVVAPGNTVTFTLAEASVAQATPEQVAVQVVVTVGFTLLIAPVKPPVHVTVPVQPVKVNVVSAPEQILAGLAEAVKFKTTAGLTVIVFSFDLTLSQVELVTHTAE